MTTATGQCHYNWSFSSILEMVIKSSFLICYSWAYYVLFIHGPIVNYSEFLTCHVVDIKKQSKGSNKDWRRKRERERKKRKFWTKHFHFWCFYFGHNWAENYQVQDGGMEHFSRRIWTTWSVWPDWKFICSIFNHK